MKKELAEKMGLKTYDFALPQDWVDEVYAKTKEWAPHFNIVWCYDKARTFGEPVALDLEATHLLNKVSAHGHIHG